MRAGRSGRHSSFLALAALTCLGAFAGCGPGEAPDSAVLVIESTPEPGAQIAIGNIPYGTTPATIRGLSAGQYYAILNLYGYKRASRSINLPAEGEVRVTVEMRPIVGFLSIESEPPGARVYLNDAGFIGTTPLVNAAVPAGNLSYELRLDNYVPLRGDLEIQEDFVYRRTHLLEAQRGMLRIFSQPTGSKIFIDDNLQENLTPANFPLAPGTYSVGAYHEGFLMGERTVVIEPNGEQSVDLVLKEGYMPLGMVLVPEGEFFMGTEGGSPDEKPRRKVHVDAFYIDKFEVTNKEFAAVFPSHRYDARKGDHPATGVSWTQAVDYAKAAGKRLPTEEEWEKAARGADAREYPWGNSFDPKLCNSSIKGVDSEPTGTKRVGLSRAGASASGLLDMAGNAYEWTSTWYQPYPGNTEIKDEYGQIYRVLRGGSYLSDRFGVRAARRYFDKIDSAKEDYGFRCALDATPPASGGNASNPKPR